MFVNGSGLLLVFVSGLVSVSPAGAQTRRAAASDPACATSTECEALCREGTDAAACIRAGRFEELEEAARGYRGLEARAQSNSRAVGLYLLACERGAQHACLRATWMMPGNSAARFEVAERSCNANERSSLCLVVANMVSMDQTPPGVTRDPERARAIYSRFCTARDLIACSRLAELAIAAGPTPEDGARSALPFLQTVCTARGVNIARTRHARNNAGRIDGTDAEFLDAHRQRADASQLINAMSTACQALAVYQQNGTGMPANRRAAIGSYTRVCEITGGAGLWQESCDAAEALRAGRTPETAEGVNDDW